MLTALASHFVLLTAPASLAETQIRGIIERGLLATKTGNARRFIEGFAADAVIIDENGTITPKQLGAFAKDMRITSYRISETKFRSLTPGSCVYAYRIREIGSYKKEAFKLDIYISTSWARRNGAWKCFLCQETNVKPKTER